jgi:hypothetical protein
VGATRAPGRHPPPAPRVPRGARRHAHHDRPARPVWAYIAFEQIPDPLHLKCFAVASSDVAVLVQCAWQGRLQEILVDRDQVFHRTLDPNAR